MLVIEESVSKDFSEIGLQTMNGKSHMSYLPRIRITFLTINTDFI